jgi:hypothetical protein
VRAEEGIISFCGFGVIVTGAGVVVVVGFCVVVFGSFLIINSCL